MVDDPLFHTFEIPDEVEDLEDEEVAYGRSWLFDFTRGEFAVDAGRVVEVDGYEAWAQWCVATVLTPRYAHMIYTDDHGTELDDVREAKSRNEAESTIAATITDALEADPRTESVREFDFEHLEGDSIIVEFIVEPSVGSPTNIRVRLESVT